MVTQGSVESATTSPLENDSTGGHASPVPAANHSASESPAATAKANPTASATEAGGHAGTGGQASPAPTAKAKPLAAPAANRSAASPLGVESPIATAKAIPTAAATETGGHAGTGGQASPSPPAKAQPPATPAAATTSANSTPPAKATVAVTLGKMSHVVVKIPGYHRAKHFVMIPDDIVLDPTLTKQILEQIGMAGETTLFIQGSCGSRHPQNMLTNEEAAMPNFNSLAPAGQKGVNRTQVINEVLLNKCCAIMFGLNNALQEVHGMCFHRENLGLYENLVQVIKHRTGLHESSFAVMHLNSEAITLQPAKDIVNKLLEQVPMPTNKLGQHRPESEWQQIELSSDTVHDLWDRKASCQVNKDFSEWGHQFFRGAGEKQKDHPTNQLPSFATDVFFCFYRKTQENQTFNVPLGSTRRLLDERNLGPLGFIFMNGAKTEKEQFLKCCESGDPSVIIKNTGGVAAQIAELVEIISDILDPLSRFTTSESNKAKRKERMERFTELMEGKFSDPYDPIQSNINADDCRINSPAWSNDYGRWESIGTMEVPVVVDPKKETPEIYQIEAYRWKIKNPKDFFTEVTDPVSKIEKMIALLSPEKVRMRLLKQIGQKPNGPQQTDRLVWSKGGKVCEPPPGWEEKETEKEKEKETGHPGGEEKEKEKVSPLQDDAKPLPEDDNFSIPDIIRVWDTVKMRGSRFTTTVKVIDPLNDSPEKALSDACTCWLSTDIGRTEIGAGDTQSNVVREAWVYHQIITRKLDEVSARFMRLSTASAILAFAATSGSVLLTTLQPEASEYPVCMRVGQVFIIVVPMSVSFISQIVSSFQMGAKKAKLVLASSEIAREIFLFRSQVGPYSLNAFIGDAEEDESGETVGSPPSNRKRFVKKVNDIFTDTVKSMNDDTLGLKDHSPDDYMNKELCQHLYGLQNQHPGDPLPSTENTMVSIICWLLSCLFNDGHNVWCSSCKTCLTKWCTCLCCFPYQWCRFCSWLCRTLHWCRWCRRAVFRRCKKCRSCLCNDIPDVEADPPAKAPQSDQPVATGKKGKHKKVANEACCALLGEQTVERKRSVIETYLPPTLEWKNKGQSLCSQAVLKEPSKAQYLECSLNPKWFKEPKKLEESKNAPVTSAAPVTYADPVTYAAPPTYAAPEYSAPVTYAAPEVMYAAPVTYAAPAPAVTDADSAPEIIYYSPPVDDFYSQLSCEEYMDWRLKPSLGRFERESPAMARSLNLSQMIIFLSGIVASILGALNIPSFIPIVLGFSTLVTSMMHFHGYQVCLVATNESMSVLQARHTLWKSQSNFDRRNPQQREELIAQTENAILNVAKAIAANSASATGSMRKDSDDGAAATRVAMAKAKAKAKAKATTPAVEASA